MWSKRKWWRLSAIVTLFIVFLASAWIGFKILDEAIRIPPKGLTMTNMIGIKRRMLLYVRRHRQMPQSLEQLPILNGYYNSTEDEWGNPIQYSITNGVVALKSFGADGKPGGTGDAEDIIESFRVED